MFSLNFMLFFVLLLYFFDSNFALRLTEDEIKLTRLRDHNCKDLGFSWLTKKGNTFIPHESAIQTDINQLFDKNNTFCSGYVGNQDCEAKIETKKDENLINQPELTEAIKNDKGKNHETCERNNRLDLFLKQIFVCSRFPKTKEGDEGIEPNEAQLKFLKEYIRLIILKYCYGHKVVEKKYLKNFIEFLFLIKNMPRLTVCSQLSTNTISNDCIEDQTDNNVVSMCFSPNPNDMSESFFTHFYDQIDANHTAEVVLEMFEKLDPNMRESAMTPGTPAGASIDDLKEIAVSAPEIKTQIKHLGAINIPLSRELMISNLLLNSFGKALRIVHKKLVAYCHGGETRTLHLKQFDPECSAEGLWLRTPYTLGITDFDDLLVVENIKTWIRCFLIFITFSVNLYTFLNVRISSPRMPYISSKLIQLLLYSNFLFLFVDLFIIYDSIYPVVKQDDYIDFIAMKNFDGDLWENVTYYVNMETVQNILYYRYDGNNTMMMEPTISSTMANIILIIQNVLLNISRTYSAIILLSIMCYVLYELRTSFCGYLSKKAARWFKYSMCFCFVVVTAGYIVAGILEYFVIDYINHATEKMNHTAICEQDAIKSYQIKMHKYMMTTFYILTSLATIILFGYHKLQETVAPVVPSNLRETMRNTLLSLFFATVIYIFSNFFVTYTDLSSLGRSSKKLDNVQIATLTTTYQWLYLLSFADPIIHPIILIYRITAMKITHQRFKKSMTKFSFSQFLKDLIIRLHHKFYPDKKFMEPNYNRFGSGNKRVSIVPEPPKKRYRVYSFQMDQDINSMLEILEKQKNSPHLI